jgi:hypothetical protein
MEAIKSSKLPVIWRGRSLQTGLHSNDQQGIVVVWSLEACLLVKSKPPRQSADLTAGPNESSPQTRVLAGSINLHQLDALASKSPKSHADGIQLHPDVTSRLGMV